MDGSNMVKKRLEITENLLENILIQSPKYFANKEERKKYRFFNIIIHQSKCYDYNNNNIYVYLLME
jgi:hypothetical protein